MGHMLDKPKTAKETGSEVQSGALGLSWASCDMQGWRTGMEDAHICITDLAKMETGRNGDWAGLALFGVLDGHGGEQVAKFCQHHLPKELCSMPLTSKGSQALALELERHLTDAFHRMDEMLRDSRNLQELKSYTNRSAGTPVDSVRIVDPRHVGCTACVCCVTEEFVVVANAGDSRAVLCRSGKAIALSEDHKPNDPRERKRITNGGGTVENCGPGQFRVNGNLNLSRALGDLEYKKDASKRPELQIISATPDVTVQLRAQDDEFVVICCDGVWDVKTNEQVVAFIRDRLPSPGAEVTCQDLESALQDLLDACVSPDPRLTNGLGTDNMTAVLVLLPPGLGRPAQAAVQKATAKQLRALLVPPLLGAETLEESSHGGRLRVRIAVPEGCKPQDLDLSINELTAQLELRASVCMGTYKSSEPIFLDLQDHLPEGANLMLPDEPAVLCSNKGFLRFVLQWSRPL